MRHSAENLKSTIYFEREYDFSLGLTAVKEQGEDLSVRQRGNYVSAR